MKKIAILLLLALPTPALCQATVSDYEAWKAECQNKHGIFIPDRTADKSGKSYCLPMVDEPAFAETPKEKYLRQNGVDPLTSGLENYHIAPDAEYRWPGRLISLAAIIFAGLASAFVLWKARNLASRATSGAVVAIGAGAIIAVRKTVKTVSALRSAMIERADKRDS